MSAESELNLLGTARDSVSNSSDPIDQDVFNLLSVALNLRLRANRGDITYLLSVSDPSPTDQVTAEQIQPVLPQIPELAKIYPEISLVEELERQRGVIVERIGLPLGMSEADCLSLLPTKFPDRSKTNDKLKLTVPLIVPQFPEVSWLQVMETAGLYVSDYLRDRITEGQLQDWPDPRRGVEGFPNKPHGLWAQDGSRYVNRKPKDVRGQLQKEERAGTHWAGAGLALLRPDMVKSMYWDLIGSKVGSAYVSCVHWIGRPRFYYYWVDDAGPSFRALVCGSEFTVA